MHVVIADDAVERLSAYVAEHGWNGPLVVMDANTREAVGERVLASFGDADPFVFEQRSALYAGLAVVEAVRGALAGRPALIAAGSGVITDIVRYAAHLAKVPFVSVPSAASMDGYASSVAALQIHGVKVTLPASTPAAIFADPRVAAAAPAELTRAGVGDLLAKATARVDWLGAHLLYGESFSAEIDAGVLEPITFVARNVEPLLAGGGSEAAALLRGLIQSGIAIALSGSSRPASGCEHHASHFWDLLAARGVRPPALHGLQVGYATRFAMRLQRFAFDGGVASLRAPTPVTDPLGPNARAWLGEPTPEIIEAVEEKRRYAADLERWPADIRAWMAVRSRLAPAIELFDDVERALDAAGFPDAAGWLGVDAETLRATFRYATRLRARYTVVDLLEGQGVLDSALGTILHRGAAWAQGPGRARHGGAAPDPSS
jgi:glycerol-1-phosphate dehydrogenase [NAD(P)+]